MSEKKRLITGSDNVWQTDAYFQAITEGLIKKSITIEEFRKMTDHEIIDDASDDLFDEQVEAAQRVADIFTSKWSKESVLKRWFGKKKL